MLGVLRHHCTLLTVEVAAAAAAKMIIESRVPALAASA